MIERLIRPLLHRAIILITAGMLVGKMVAEVSDRTRLAIETLNRLKGANPSDNPSVQAAAARVADQLRGEPELVDLVGGFELKGRERELIEFVIGHPESPQAGEAIRLVLNGGAEALLRSELSTNAPSNDALLQSMALSGDPRCLPLVRPLITDTQRTKETRLLVARVFASSGEGSTNLLSLTRASEISPDLMESVGALLRSSRWPEIRAAAPASVSVATTAAPLMLPPMTELIALPGDPERGKAVFRRADIACVGCHQVQGEGVDFGPKLTEIGAKLGRDALITSIVEPSSGISFGFEAWRITLKDGDELLGLIASETVDEVLLKQQGGQLMPIRKAEIAAREKLMTSIMPTGLYETLSLSEFGDLISYLSSLKAASR